VSCKERTENNGNGLTAKDAKNAENAKKDLLRETEKNLEAKNEQKAKKKRILNRNGFFTVVFVVEEVSFLNQ
jgi:SOS response regulatory protein OraA/RecX